MAGSGRLARVEVAALAVTLGALLVRACVAAMDAGSLDWDVAWYSLMGRSFLERGEFVVPWSGDLTHHYPPLYPVLLSGAYRLAGFSMATTKGVAFALGLAFVVVAGWLTWRLFGRTAGLLVAAVVASFPLLINYDALGYSESLLGLLYVVTLWAILESLDRPPFILLAGVGAGLSFLTKASMGPFLLLAGCGGLAWRLRHRGLAAARDPWYVGAAFIFATFVGLWTFRNVSHFGLGGWETQPYATESLLAAWRQPSWPLVWLAKLTELLLFLGCICAPWLRQVRAGAAGVLRDERRSAIWLGALMPSFIATFFAAAFSFSEGRPAFDPADTRYFLVSLVPALWLCFESLEPSSPEPRRKGRGWLLAATCVAVALLLAVDVPYVMGARSSGRLQVLLVVLALALGGLLVVLLHPTAPRLDGRRNAHARMPQRSLLLGAIIPVSLCFAAAWAGMANFFPLAAAAASVLLLKDERWRAVTFAAILLAASLSGGASYSPWGAVAEDTPSLLRSGDGVIVPDDLLLFAATSLPEDVRLVPLYKIDHASAISAFVLSDPLAHGLPNHTSARAWRAVYHEAPGSALLRATLRDAGLSTTVDAYPVRLVLWAPNATRAP